jgi:hypothetical protein
MALTFCCGASGYFDDQGGTIDMSMVRAIEPACVALPELWGGVECTINRVGDQYFDQLARSRHDVRLADLRLFADLGVRALRYPVLWERTAPEEDLAHARWQWADERLDCLRGLGIRPIIGLVHRQRAAPHKSARSAVS